MGVLNAAAGSGLSVACVVLDLFSHMCYFQEPFLNPRDFGGVRSLEVTPRVGDDPSH